MIEVLHVSRQFGSFRAVDDISFSIKTGEIVGLLGPNGAGKTTTMRMITGFLEPTEGKILIDGLDVVKDSVQAKEKIGYMPESAPLYGEMLVADYLSYVASMQGKDPSSRVKELSSVCGLKEVMHKKISQLSRGNRQRVGLAHALMGDPEILILDEPTSGLDPNQVTQVRNLIKEIGKTRTVIISTHILSEVEMLCNRVLIINEGKKVADSNTDELREHYGHESLVSLSLSSSEPASVISTLEEFAGSGKVSLVSNENGILKLTVSGNGKNDGDLCPEIAKLVVGKGWKLYELSVQKNSLEDVFHSLTKGGEE